MRQDRLEKAALAATALIALASTAALLLPGDGLPSQPDGLDKVAHFLAFAVLTFPAIMARPRHAAWLVPVAILYGGAIEMIQPSFGRGAEWGDFLADALGAGFGAASGWWVHRCVIRPRLGARKQNGIVRPPHPQQHARTGSGRSPAPRPRY